VKTDKHLARENGTSSPDQKKPYRSPELLDYGDVRKITQNVGTSGAPDGGVSPNSFTQ
jgi:hypothetical protein